MNNEVWYVTVLTLGSNPTRSLLYIIYHCATTTPISVYKCEIFQRRYRGVGHQCCYYYGNEWVHSCSILFVVAWRMKFDKLISNYFNTGFKSHDHCCTLSTTVLLLLLLLLRSVFGSAKSFNADIGGWDTSAVRTMSDSEYIRVVFYL